MPRFICAVHTDGDTPRAYALVEQVDGAAGATYHVRRLHTLPDEGAADALTDALADEPQFTAATTVVATGGRRAAEALHARGPSVVPVALLDGKSGDGAALSVAEQVLVDTFEGLYRAGAVVVDGALDEGSAAVAALYRASDLEAAAPDGDRDENGDLDVAPDGPAPDSVRQSSGEAALSTASVGRDANTKALGADPTDRPLRGRIAGASGTAAPDLGAHRAVAVALALACWYGEYAADELPTTDQARAILQKRTRTPVRV
ncbi:MAG TPA: hypothetical protein VK610_08425 [Rhodothermales bacterium]|nr:hypothetical protein [Rhodothermales bacterium]